MVFDELFEAPNVLFVLRFNIIPEGAQLLVILSIGDVLVVAPQRVQALAQIVYHVVVMVGVPGGFSDLLSLFLCRECYNFSPLEGNLYRLYAIRLSWTVWSSDSYPTSKLHGGRRNALWPVNFVLLRRRE